MVSALPEKGQHSPYYEVRLGGRTTLLQLALTDREHAKGLMYRESLPRNHGMVFLFDSPQQMGFWMRNTRIPLDIGYFTADGVLREVYPMEPYDENLVRSKRKDLSIAVEMNQGWFAENAVSPGAVLDLSDLAEAVRVRGFDLEWFLR
jgi:hypothetical protein